MIIAKEKKKTNIAEYVLYMWQIEDLLRAFAFDASKLYDALFASQSYPEEQASEIKYWYENIAEMMNVERVKEKGHVQVVQNIVNDMTDLHFTLIHEKRDQKYSELVYASVSNLVDFRKMNNVSNDLSDVELCLMALYGILMLKLQKKEISKDTYTAMEGFTKILAYLSSKYKDMEEKDLKEE